MQQMRVIDIVDPGPRGRLVPAQQLVPLAQCGARAAQNGGGWRGGNL